MWTNGDDFNDDGERVRLYQPIAYSSGRALSQDDPTASFIGGSSSTAYCSNCHASMEHLVQLYNSNRKMTYHILGCNQAKCVNALFSEGKPKFCLGGGGVFFAERQEAKETTPTPTPAPAPAVAPQPVPKKEEETNDWNVDSEEEDDDLGDLEEQVAAMELKANNKNSENKPKSNKTTKKKTRAQQSGNNTNNLPCFELHSLLEPPGKSRRDEEDEEDWIGSGGNNNATNDAKIQQMLAKYMAEEEDEDILAALRGTTANGGGGGGGKSREKDERLKASDRALLAFTDRIKRSPRQVLRYAPNGMPLWSIPKPQGPSKKSKKSKVNFQQGTEGGDAAIQSMTIPPCSCGAERRFEFQLMPSLLHVLEVDKHAQLQQEEDGATSSTTPASLDAIMSADYGGMNWGAIAVYTCTKEDCSCSEDYLVVQASVDATPCKRAVAPADAPVFIKEGQTFDALTNEEDLIQGCNDDDDDDDTVYSVVDESDLVFTLDG